MLASNCKTAYSVWQPENPSEMEAYAAQELSRYLQRITGANFPLIRGGAAPEKAIAVGAEAARTLGIDPAREALGAEGFLIRSVGERLVIAGGPKRGTLYGVYEYLESVLGVRWYTDAVERVPERNDLPFAPLNIKQVPALEYREVYFPRVTSDGPWSARNKNNGHFPRLSAQEGGKVAYFPFVHSFESILPVDEYFGMHPEYYSMVDGVRVREHTQLCLTNHEVLEKTIARVCQWLSEHPDVTIVSISQNDWYNPCACPACRAIDEREGSHAGTLIEFVNRVAEAIEPEYPDIVIDTLAYQYTRTPPLRVRPRHNVCVRLCSIECCFAHPLSECDRIFAFEKSIHGDSFPADLMGWAKVSDRLYVWDYVVNFHHYVMPFPNFQVLGPNIRFFIENHVKGIFEEGATTPRGGTELAEMRAWVLSKLLWNPYQDTEPLIRDFACGYYGAAGPYIISYMELLQRALAETPNAHFGIYDPPRVRYLTEKVAAQANVLFDKAEAAAENPAVLERVRTARLPLRYWEILSSGRGTPGREGAISMLEADLRARGILDITEGRPLEFSIARLREGITYRILQTQGEGK